MVSASSASSSSVEATRALRDALANLSRVAPPASGAAVLEAAKALESPPEEDTLGGIDGLWVTEWTSMDPPYHELQMDDDDDDDDDDGDGDVYVPRAFPLPLAALSFGAFGALNVIATRTVNIVRGAEYVLAIVFVDAGDGAGDDDDEFAEGVLFLAGVVRAGVGLGLGLGLGLGGGGESPVARRVRGGEGVRGRGSAARR